MIVWTNLANEIFMPRTEKEITTLTVGQVLFFFFVLNFLFYFWLKHYLFFLSRSRYPPPFHSGFPISPLPQLEITLEHWAIAFLALGVSHSPRESN